MTKVRRLPRSQSPSGAGTSEQERHPAAPTLPRHAVDLLRNLWVAFGPWRLLLATGLALAVAGTAPFPANAPPSAVDAAVLDWMEEQMPSGLGRLLALVYPMTGTRFTAALVLSVLFFLMTRRYWAEMACLAAGTGGILLLNNYWLKPLFSRQRPPHGLLGYTGYSFPSGHAAGAVVFYFMVCSLLAAHYPRMRRPMLLVSSAWVALVSLSTLCCRAHWLSDIIAGVALGYLWMSLCMAAFAVWERHRRPPCIDTNA